jgi:hypothetical protein
MEGFELLKRTFPISKFDRICDAYRFLKEEVSPKTLKQANVNLETLNHIIKEGEKYIYMVGKQDGKFMTKSMSTTNFEIIRKKIFKTKDD